MLYDVRRVDRVQMALYWPLLAVCEPMCRSRAKYVVFDKIALAAAQKSAILVFFAALHIILMHTATAFARKVEPVPTARSRPAGLQTIERHPTGIRNMF